MEQKLFKLTLLEGNVLKIGFGEQSSNDQIVKEVKASTDEMAQEGGPLERGAILKINGPASLPVAFVIAHVVNHRFNVVAFYDPKLGEKGKYVVAVSHSPDVKVGDLLD